MIHHRKRLSAAFAAIIVLFGAGITESFAQPRLSDTGNTQQDFSGISAQFADGRPIDPLKIAAAYMYEMNYDSTRILYTITEFRKNSSRLFLKDWAYLTSRDEWDTPTLNDSSGTAFFTIHTGDTLSAYREFEWYMQRSGAHRPDNYSATDTLSYSIELTDSATGARLALLDSLGIMRRDTPGYPSIHGTHALFSTIPYIVPSSLHGRRVTIRFLVRSRGGGNFYFIRRNIRTVHLSDNLLDTACLRCNWNYAGSGLGKHSPRELEDVQGKSTELRIGPNPTSGDVSIQLTSPDPGSTISIYDIAGNLLFIPELSSGAQSSIVHYHFDTPGHYYIALQRNGNLVASYPITVIR